MTTKAEEMQLWDSEKEREKRRVLLEGDIDKSHIGMGVKKVHR